MKVANTKPRSAHKRFHTGSNAVITSYTIQKVPLDLNNKLNMSKEAGYEDKPRLGKKKKKVQETIS